MSTNTERIDRAGDILEDYATRVYAEDEPEETNCTDLLADLMHYAKAQDFDFDTCLRMARTNFEAETN